MSQGDVRYFAARLRAELAAAAAATSDGARKAHEGLAHLYAERLAGREYQGLPFIAGVQAASAA